LITLYEWKYFTRDPHTWAFTGLKELSRELEEEGFIEICEYTEGDSMVVRITVEGEKYTERHHLIGLLEQLLRSSKNYPLLETTIERLVAGMSMKVLPELLVHKKPSIRLLGKYAAERQMCRLI